MLLGDPEGIPDGYEFRVIDVRGDVHEPCTCQEEMTGRLWARDSVIRRYSSIQKHSRR
jgi:hypothetical protein